jgi:hypothetical protein
MKPVSKVVPSHDIGAVRGKIAGNPNLDPEIINKRFEQSDTDNAEVEAASSSIPKGLRGLEDLIFLGAARKDVSIGDFEFQLTTLSNREQDMIFKEALSLSEKERLMFFKKGILALSIKKINKRLLSSYLEEDTFEERLNLVGGLQQSIFEYLFNEIESMIAESSKLLTAENLKK